MNGPRTQSHRSRLKPLLFCAALAGLTLSAWAIVATKVFVLYLGLLACVLVGLVLHVLIVVRSRHQQPELLQLLLDLASDVELVSIHSSLAHALKDVARQTDPIFRELALSRLEAIAADCQNLGNGTVGFTSTESWRVVYEALLRSPGLHLYRSVAYIETAHYWQDGPGRQSTQLNIELHDAGVISVERTAIIADHLWPADELFPCEPLHSWLDQQHRYGIWLRLVRESALENDMDLLCDYGIYGSRAVGLQTADPAGRTIRFVLDFNFEKVHEAEQNWNRLAVYATSYRELLDQKH